MFGQGARVFFTSLGDGHDAVGLVITMFRVGDAQQGRRTQGALDGGG